ncbi:MAG: LPS export ABC transporter ATP-binding protein [Gammaproteobacteria bacterium]|nr:LPS export ABC transporter ATP-binding protein [Gammaproteobacteria bacterium]MCF6231176.1 LPS export ABC transporter ATP-binding protein [Gammaproteobacteria bacterium]
MSDLVVDGVAKQYGSRQVVKDVSLCVNRGEVVGLLGPNGAGKTTCFYMVAGLVPSDKGKITLYGKDLTTLPLHARAKLGIGYLPQEASVFRKLSVSDNIMAVLELNSELSPDQRQRKLEGLLQEFHLTQIQDSLGMSLSGGERRRVEIARALAADPTFILLDEPFAGVDPISVLDIQQIIKHLCQRGIGVLITDHNVRETLGICQRAYIMSAGEVLATGTPQEVLENQQVKDVYLGHGFKM